MTRQSLVAAVLCVLACALTAEEAHLHAVSQKGRAFSRPEISISSGDTIRFTNDDGFLHQIFVHAPGFSVDSDEQRPGENVDVKFPAAGTYTVLCAIHPKMALVVHVR